MEVNSWLTGRRGICLPFTDRCGPLFRDARAAAATWDELVRQGESRNWRYIEIRDHGDWQPAGATSAAYFGHHLALDLPEAELLRNLDDGTRRAVRKAQRTESLTVEFSRDWPSVERFYRLVCQTRRRQGLPPQPVEFFRNIQQHILASGKGVVVLARHGGDDIAGAVYFRFQDTVLYKFGASDFRFQHLRANNLVMWEAIRRFKAEGAKSLDFGRTSASHDSLRRFKRSWGAQETEIRYMRFDLAKRSFVSVPDHTSGWHTRAFRALPSVLSRSVGRLLYRHIA